MNDNDQQEIVEETTPFGNTYLGVFLGISILILSMGGCCKIVKSSCAIDSQQTIKNN